jgi:hypothetical protein
MFHVFWITTLFCGLTVPLLADAYWTKRAMVWWQQRQIERLYQATEAVRDQVLQDLFCLRRHLELIPASPLTAPLLTTPPLTAALTVQPSTAAEAEQLLKIADRCHQTLAQVSDRLFSPYAIESLAIALQELVAGWETAYPQSLFSYTVEARDGLIDSPAINSPAINSPLNGPLEQRAAQSHQFLLIWLDELCRLLRAHKHPLTWTIQLKHEDADRYEMEINLSQINLSQNLTGRERLATQKIAVEIRYLCRIFRILQKGQCQLHRNAGTWRFRLKW